jgi:hypothetical protein
MISRETSVGNRMHVDSRNPVAHESAEGDEHVEMNMSETFTKTSDDETSATPGKNTKMTMRVVDTEVFWRQNIVIKGKNEMKNVREGETVTGLKVENAGSNEGSTRITVNGKNINISPVNDITIEVEQKAENVEGTLIGFDGRNLKKKPHHNELEGGLEIKVEQKIKKTSSSSKIVGLVLDSI